MTNTMRAVLFGGLACAILDGAAATITFARMGLSFTRLWQGVASGLLGRASFQHGAASAALGLFFHVLIAMVAALVFNLAIRYLPALLEHFLLSGALYGVLVFFFMNLVVIPLSAIPKRPFSLSGAMVPIIVHIFCVGLPISIAASRFPNR
jgi:hypothetical protein